MPQQRCVLPHVAYSRELSFEQAGVEKWQRRIAEGRAQARREGLAEGRAVEFWVGLLREAAAEQEPAPAPAPGIAPPGFRFPDQDGWEPPAIAPSFSRLPAVQDDRTRLGPLLFWLLFAVFCLFFGPRGLPFSSQADPASLTQHDPRSAPPFRP